MRALVTGATGFIGSRLVEHLARSGIRVRALVRSGLLADGPGTGCERVRGDVGDEGSLRPAVAGCDAVYHCVWGGRTLKEARRVNVIGTRNVVGAAARGGVRRVVHLSSVAAHGRRLPAVLTEDHPLAGRGDAYAVSKAEGEREALAVGTAHGLEVVVLRPTLVYGPGSPIWLVGYFERVKSERLALVDGGRGLANLLHVDDLIDAMLLAAERPGIAGEAFLVSGEQPVTWRQYLGYFARMCGKPPPASISRHRAYLEVQWGRLYGTLTGRPRRITGMDLVEMTQRTRVSIDKARRLLRWEPRVALDAGMNAAEAWLRQQGHLPPAAPSAEEPMRARGAVRVALS